VFQSVRRAIGSAAQWSSAPARAATGRQGSAHYFFSTSAAPRGGRLCRPGCSEVHVTHSDNKLFATLTINRPEAHNALSPGVIDSVVYLLQELKEQQDLRALFVRSAGPTFCAGGDLKHFRSTAQFSKEENVKDALRLSEVFDQLYNFPRPTISMVQGNAFGGAVGIISSCDMAFAVKSAKFALSEVKLGIIPATISPYVLAKMGIHCNRYFLTAEAFGAEEARRVGLLSDVVEDAEGLQAVEAKLQDQFMIVSPDAVSASKDLILKLRNRPLDYETREWTATRLAEVRESVDGQEGMLAFIEKRKPNWATVAQ